MIVGIGLDFTEVPRIAAILGRWGDRFAKRVFTPGERAYAEGKANTAFHLAARFAAKEAALKALSVPRGLTWHEMEVVGGGHEPPRLLLCGEARAAADRLGVTRVHLTLTHTAELAGAVVIAEAEP